MLLDLLGGVDLDAGLTGFASGSPSASSSTAQQTQHWGLHPTSAFARAKRDPAFFAPGSSFQHSRSVSQPNIDLPGPSEPSWSQTHHHHAQDFAQHAAGLPAHAGARRHATAFEDEEAGGDGGSGAADASEAMDDGGAGGADAPDAVGDGGSSGDAGAAESAGGGGGDAAGAGADENEGQDTDPKAGKTAEGEIEVEEESHEEQEAKRRANIAAKIKPAERGIYQHMNNIETNVGKVHKKYKRSIAKLKQYETELVEAMAMESEPVLPGMEDLDAEVNRGNAGMA